MAGCILNEPPLVLFILYCFAYTAFTSFASFTGSRFSKYNDREPFSMQFYPSSVDYDNSSGLNDIFEPHDQSGTSWFIIPVPPRNNSTLTLGYMVADQTRYHSLSKRWKSIAGALSFAIEQINKEKVVPGYQLDFVIRDTRGQINDSLYEMSNLWRDGIVGFIGPSNDCKNEAMLAGAWNLPILSHACSDDEVSDKERFPTFARTFPPATQITKAVVSLLRHFNWTKFSIVYGETKKAKGPWEPIALRLKDLAEEHNMTINHVKTYPEPHLTLVAGNPFPNIVQETYIDTRVYVFFGYLNAMVDMMINLNDRGLLDTGQYVVIYVESPFQVPHEEFKYFKRTFDRYNFPNLRGARSLLVIKPTPEEDSQEFYNAITEYNARPPLNLTFPPDWTKSNFINAFSLYDAVTLYAYALSKVLEDGGSFLDGRAIISKLLGHQYTSIQGYESKIDKDGNPEGNYTVLAYLPIMPVHGPGNFTEVVNYTVDKIANFRLAPDSELPKFHLFDGMTIQWVGGKPPVDEPVCGYRKQRCLKPKSYLTQIIAGILGGISLMVLVILLVIYRNWRNEQKIAGLLWKIDSHAIQCTEMNTWERKMVAEENVNTNCGISMVSMDSRNTYAQVYTYVGKYKGQTVALKTFHVHGSDLTRKDKLEMKLMRDLRHTNVNSFIGACMESSVLTLVTTYCAKGSLQDVLENDDIKLDQMFIASLIKDLIQGMLYIHHSDLVYHGNLKSSNCVVTSRWTLQVADNNLLDIRNAIYNKDDHHVYYRNLLWKAPEILRGGGKIKGSQPGDVYAFAIILHEIYGRSGPFGNIDMDPEEIIRKVRDPNIVFRPDTSSLDCSSYVINVMTSCWEESQEARPLFNTIWDKLKPMRAGMKRNIFDHMLAMMENYQEHLEELVDERTEQLSEEKKKTETLLYRMLPRSVADQLKRGESVRPEAFDIVTIYFSDICGFTSLSAESTPMQIVDMLNDLYTCFDSIIKNFDVYKVETIGDAYMVVSGLPLRNGHLHAAEIASMSLALLKAIKSFTIRHRPDDVLKLRIGIHSGPCVAGVVGSTMPRYTLFGDTVNTASRMESNGEALKIHISSDCKKILAVVGGFHLEERGYIAMKGKGNQLTYWLIGEDQSKRPAMNQGIVKHSSSRELTGLDRPSRFKLSNHSPITANHSLQHQPSLKSSGHNLAMPSHTQGKPSSLVPPNCHKSSSFSEGINGIQNSYHGSSLKERTLRGQRSLLADTCSAPIGLSISNSNRSSQEYPGSCSESDTCAPTEVTTLLTDHAPQRNNCGASDV